MKHNLLISALLLFISAIVSLTTWSAIANVIDTSRVAGGDRWFEVEMIIFQRQHDGNLVEQFHPNDQLEPPARYFDLLRPLYQTDITPLLRQLELCPQQQSVIQPVQHHHPSDEQPVNLSDYIELFRPAHIGALCIFEPQPALWQQPLFASHRWIANTPFPSVLLQQPVGVSPHQPRPYLLERDALQLSDVARQLQQQADIEVLLHSGYRQAPVTDRRSIASRWYAGRNLQQISRSDAITAKPDSGSVSLRPDQLLERIEQRYQQLSDDVPLRLYRLPQKASPLNAKLDEHGLDEHGNTPLWQLDGFVRVHLDHYLFLNTDFILRQLDDEGTILQHRIQFSRRVISGEMHYIDHPRLGMVVQIRRYQPPAVESDRSNSVQ
jgi:hypothetical protein